MVDLQITEEQALALKSLLELSRGEMSSEIADTENPSYRRSLLEHRQHLSDIAAHLERALARGESAAPLAPSALDEGLAHPATDPRTPDR